MNQAALSFDSVRKAFGAHVALAGFTATVERGELFGLVGVNGAGKTTLIKCMLDFALPDAGEIRLLGVPHRSPIARAPLAFLPERFVPPFFLTGTDFLRYMAALHDRQFDPERAVAKAADLDLDAVALRRPVRSLSKGMTQKLGLAACLLSQKEVYVLDEPTSGLDPRARALVKRELSALRDAGRTVFMTSHLLADVEELCDRMAILHAGELRFIGTPGELLARHRAASVEAAFLAAIEPTASM